MIGRQFQPETVAGRWGAAVQEGENVPARM